AIFNTDDERCAELCERENHKTFGIFSPADAHADNISEVRFENGFGVQFYVSYGGATTKCRIPMPYNFTVYNSLAAISACTHFGVPLDVCAAALEDFSLEGRFEKVASDAPFDIVIDYAHNGESLKNALLAARKFCAGKLICVFGSVGERTEMRRKALGEAANANADVCVITSDNPNFEDPVKIAREIAALVTDKPYKIIADRKEAIEYAVSIAERGDFVLLAGKGHEKYQLVRGEKVPFDERQIIKEATKTKIQI
ncbi:MAG: UDP-N-acetylmuramoyl-L-alanyl-D-glutamate--2,6-diaminopimelate ligase, partial [Clostridiales bacterium]|nr:UDP-N-acetylmuramoyl-L-alanyl-D-glutamate--2,6-diaminopimelate ligase [Clostridiales bacterium]